MSEPEPTPGPRQSARQPANPVFAVCTALAVTVSLLVIAGLALAAAGNSEGLRMAAVCAPVALLVWLCAWAVR